ncbi:hypothetical protein RB620_27180 [Paenibacillus sp. LHD-117]|uniref:hypothetical protein n=1 Tax=Paenibacillus sp. LHD-117 TaxID=3071412 RepID=UPI0027E1B7E6|nr:hypothetical protein [Paenibacillus sp. LHD-117]MDQ6423119.1 hypothetical protein [Paenibacillus sp. LHD-117]
MEFFELVKQHFGSIVSKYDLCLEKIVDDEVALIARNFAISIWRSRDGVDIVYLMLDDRNSLVKINISSYLAMNYNENDRRGIIISTNLLEKIINGLIIHSRGLEDHFVNILLGDKGWFNEYKKNKYSEDFQLASTYERKIIEPILLDNASSTSI